MFYPSLPPGIHVLLIISLVNISHHTSYFLSSCISSTHTCSFSSPFSFPALTFLMSLRYASSTILPPTFKFLALYILPPLNCSQFPSFPFQRLWFTIITSFFLLYISPFIAHPVSPRSLFPPSQPNLPYSFPYTPCVIFPPSSLSHGSDFFPRLILYILHLIPSLHLNLTSFNMDPHIICDVPLSYPPP